MPIVKLVERNSDARSYTVEDCLTTALQDVQEGTREANKCVVVFLDDSGRLYSVGYQQAGLSSAEMIALVEVLKHQLIVEMQEGGE
jgi:hypothetical protein